MNPRLFEELLHEDEGTTIDFKEAQYQFERPSDEQKSELLKDILALANAWRRADAYILIGVRDVKGGRSRVTGVSEHLDDAKLQQFVNSKVQRPLVFTYEAFSSDGQQVGIIHIPIQERPFFLKHDYGKLRRHVVYVRRGSSTAEADPEEVQRMGLADAAERSEPLLELEFADLKEHRGLGHKLTLHSELLDLPRDGEIPDYGVYALPFGGADLSTSFTNKDFYRDVARYWAQQSFLSSVGFVIRNKSSVTAADVRVRLVLPENTVTVVGQSKLARIPDTTFFVGVGALARGEPELRVEHYGSEWLVTASLGKIQPKDTQWSERAFFVGSRESGTLTAEATVFADNLAKPLTYPMELEFTSSRRSVVLDELLNAAKKWKR